MPKSFTLSHFLRQSGEVLSALEDHEVVLTRRDGEGLFVSTLPGAESQRAGLELLAEAVLEGMQDESVGHALGRAIATSARWTSALSQDQREALIREIAKAAAESVGLGSAQPLVTSLDRWRRAARIRAVARPQSAHLTRPVSIPDDVDDPSIEKASGVVELPLRVRWSHPQRSYDLDNPRQRRLVYEQVLSEGLDDDVRRYIDLEKLIADWDELVVPQRVRRAWAEWLRSKRGVDVAC